MDAEKMTTLLPIAAQHFPFISTCSMSKFLIKVIKNLEKHLPLLSRKKKITEMVVIVCEIGVVLLKDDTVISKEQIQKSIFRILRRLIETDTKYELPILDEFFHVAYDSNEKEILTFSEDTQLFVYSCYPAAVEAETIKLMSRCWKLHKTEKSSDLKNLLLNSALVSTCSKVPSVFRKALSVATSAWFLTDGSEYVQIFMAELVAVVEMGCEDQSIISHFSDHLQHLVLLYLIEPAVFHGLKSSNGNIWTATLSALESKVCNVKDIVMLMGTFPLWYRQLLNDVHQKENERASRLLQILWSCPIEELLQRVEQILLAADSKENTYN